MNIDKIDDIKNKMEKESGAMKRNFASIDGKLLDSCTKLQLFGLEKAIEDRVPLSKFKNLEKNVTTCLRTKEFVDYKKMLEISLRNI